MSGSMGRFDVDTSEVPRRSIAAADPAADRWQLSRNTATSFKLLAATSCRCAGVPKLLLVTGLHLSSRNHPDVARRGLHTAPPLVALTYSHAWRSFLTFFRSLLSLSNPSAPLPAAPLSVAAESSRAANGAASRLAPRGPSRPPPTLPAGSPRPMADARSRPQRCQMRVITY